MTTHPPAETGCGFARFAGLGTTSNGIWHKSAPASVRKAMSRDNLAEGWSAWTGYLSERARPVPPDLLEPNGEASLPWGLLRQYRPGASEIPPQGYSAKGAEQWILGWLREVAGGAFDIDYALDALILSRRLPQLGGRLPADAWFALLAHLIGATGEAEAIDPDRQPLLVQLLAGELPLTLAYLLPELKPCRALAGGARRVLSDGLIDLLDGDGMLHGRHFALMHPLLACWTRCLVLSKGMKRHCFTASSRRRYKLLVRHALRFARYDGSAMLGPAPPDGDRHVLRAAVAAGGSAEDRAIAELALPATARRAKRRPALALPEVATQSDGAATALLRTDWSKSAERLAVVHPGRIVQMELGCGKEVVLNGRWSLEVTRDGKPLAPESDWEQICWVSDGDIDYLELEIELQDDVCVQRQIALAREDRFLLLADAVLGRQPGELEYRSCLPLQPGVAFCPADDSREGCLVGKKRRAMVFPLALAEWRSLWAAGELQATAEGLQLTHSARAARLYAPLFLDLDRRRLRRPWTWRRLTVAESLEAVSADVAVGYRVAVGGTQWLVYRSLAAKANRTLLGHNLSTEALIARFDPSGEVEPLIEIE